jgi:hypothetical protein
MSGTTVLVDGGPGAHACNGWCRDGEHASVLHFDRDVADWPRGEVVAALNAGLVGKARARGMGLAILDAEPAAEAARLSAAFPFPWLVRWTREDGG